MQTFIITEEEVVKLFSNLKSNLSFQIDLSDRLALIYTKNSENKGLSIINITKNDIYLLKRSINAESLFEFEFGKDIKDCFGIKRKEYSLKIDDSDNCLFEEHPTIEKRRGMILEIPMIPLSKDKQFKLNNDEIKKLYFNNRKKQSFY